MEHAREVCITGIGAVSALGVSVPEIWRRLVDGHSGVGPIRRFDAGRFSCRLAAEIVDAHLRLGDIPYGHEAKRMDRFVRYALAAAADAFAGSGLLSQGHCPPDGGLFIGVGTGGLPHLEAGVLLQEKRGPRKVSPYLIPSLISNMAAGMIALNYDFRGPQYTIAGACASGNQAIGQALHAIRAGTLQWALAGGTEAAITPIGYSGLQAMHALSDSADASCTPRPFDQNCDGMVVGEGAAVFVLEERSHAEARGAALEARVSGYATCSGGTQITLQAADDLARCMDLTLRDARLESGDVDCVYAQAAGLVKGDECELEALQRVFTERGAAPSVTSIKGHIGHTFAASGPLNVMASVETLRTQVIPPTLNLQTIANRYADVDVVRETQPRHVRHCLINSFGFGGVNASLIISGFEPMNRGRPV
jgi:3-oxoacyl-[acyl-carrier-protein] synthase II